MTNLLDHHHFILAKDNFPLQKNMSFFPPLVEIFNVSFHLIDLYLICNVLLLIFSASIQNFLLLLIYFKELNNTLIPNLSWLHHNSEI